MMKEFNFSDLPEHQPDARTDVSPAGNLINYLLTGLEKQKDELGAIAFELIDLLRQPEGSDTLEQRPPPR
jgi:hypothetical protein